MTSNKTMIRFYFVVFGLFIFSFVLIGKLVYIQFAQGKKYREQANFQVIKNVVLQPSRGNIYSADGNILATSVPRYELHWDATVPSSSHFQSLKKELAFALAKFFGKSEREMLKKLEKARVQKNRYMLIARNLTHSDYQEIKSFPIFNLNIYKGGLIVEQRTQREHPLGKVAERTIGYEKLDANGAFFRVGLEGAFSQYLRGEEGTRLKQKIANNQWKPINDNNEKEPTEGFDIYTTIDVNMQDIAHNALLNQLETYRAAYGCAVVMEVNTGDVRAIVNLGRTSKGGYFEKLNYAIGEAHEPGSTFKLMGMIAALEDKMVNVDTPIETGKGELTFFGKYKVRDTKKEGFGTISAAKVFEVSSNVGMVKIIYGNYKNNPQKFVDRLYNMGLNKVLKVPIKGEAMPKIPHPTDANWDGLDLPWMAFGYGLSITPLQTLTFYNAIANNGEMVKPKFIKQISRLGSQPQKIYAKEVINPSICSKSTLDKVKQMLLNVVNKEWGTAYSIKDENFLMAGKTGTCQVDYTTDDIQYTSSFVGYFPAEKPKYSCIVMIYRPDKTKGYYGANVAAPVFKTIAQKIYNNIPKEVYIKSSEIEQLKSLGLKNTVRAGVSNIDVISTIGRKSNDGTL